MRFFYNFWELLNILNKNNYLYLKKGRVLKFYTVIFFKYIKKNTNLSTGAFINFAKVQNFGKVFYLITSLNEPTHSDS